MAIDRDADIPEPIEDMLRSETGEVKELSQGRKKTIYKVYPGSRAPVSKRYGQIWRDRLDAARAARKDLEQGWEESIRYYNNDQIEHRSQMVGRSGNAGISRRINATWSETENLIFSGINSMIPAVYAKNPQAEFTSVDETDKPFATMYERLVNSLAAMSDAPGFAAKNKVKQCTILASLTNAGWVEIGYQQLEDSNEEVLSALADIGNKLAEAKDEQEVLVLEGQLQALESKFDIARPSGPIMRVRSPDDVVVDPDSTEPGHSDARWIMACDMLPTQFLIEKYGERVSEDDETFVKSLYKPTHVLPINGGDDNESIASTVNNFRLIKDSGFASGDYGYRSKDDYDNATRTKVWFVWDRTSRRVFLYHDEDWTWPIWVWDDPFKLPRFFPFFKLSFLLPPIGAHGKGETTYVLDQQDAVNEINDEWRRARQRVKGSVFFNARVISDKDVEAVLKGADGTARGINDLPDGTKLEDHFYTPTPSVIQYRDLFDISPKLASIDRIFGINEVLRGAQFKTNTTNQAINTYNSVSSMRLDDKIDSIEDFVGSIYYNITLMCVQFMQMEQVIQVIGEQYARQWTNMSPDEFRARFTMRVVGGSTQKPTSSVKKQEAMQTGQVLGQFANASPMAMLIFLKLLESSFDDVNIREEDWTSLRQTIEQQMQSAAAAPDGGAGASRGAPGEASATSPGDPLAAMAQTLDALPPQLRAVLMQAMQQGVPATQALQSMMRQMPGSNGNTGAPPVAQ